MRRVLAVAVRRFRRKLVSGILVSSSKYLIRARSAIHAPTRAKGAEARGIVAAARMRRTEMRLRMRYERSEPRIARREPQKKAHFQESVLFFVRSGSPKVNVLMSKCADMTIICRYGEL
jgi:hypothetical protein